MKQVKGFNPVGIIIAVLLLFSSVFTVFETDNAMKLRLGKIETDSKGHAVIYHPGLHFKLPIINQVKAFDMRLRTLAVTSSRMLTENQKYLLVDYYAKWRITDLAQYYKSTSGNEVVTMNLLQQKINDSLRAAFGRHTVSEVISAERANIMSGLRKEANANAASLGIEVMDVRIKKIDLPEQVSASVYERMRAERRQVATKHRSDGRKEAEKIMASADADVVVTIATAGAKAAKVRAEGVQQSAAIYANAYNKNPGFYAMYRSLIAYKHTFKDSTDVLVMSPDNDFFTYLDNPSKTPDGLAYCKKALTDKGGAFVKKFLGL
jgi:modulator of FtsH protease HflC